MWTERRTQAALIRLEARASYEVGGRGVYLVLAGTGECEGKPLRQYTTVFLEHGERTVLRASAASEFLHYGLPDLSGMAAVSHTSGAIQAAE